MLFSSLSAFAATAPDPPTNLVATPVKPTQVNLFWSAPANNGGAGVNNYKIEFKTGSGSWSVLATTSGPETFYMHENLITDTTYAYRVSANNNAGTSNPSSEISATPNSSSTASLPGAPTNLIGVAASPTQANLSWSAPANNGGYPISGYKIEYRIGSGSYMTLVENTGSTITTYSHSPITTGTVYVYRVYAITAFGTGTSPTSEAVVKSTATSALAAPGAPTALSASAVSPTQINLSWSAPTNNGGASITGYKIESKSGTGSFTSLVANTGTTSTTYSHTGLATGTAYTYRVYAINSVGTSVASSEIQATPSSSSAPGLPGVPTQLTTNVISGTQINLSWSAPANNGGSAITGYKIESKSGTGSYAILVANTGSAATTYSHTGLTSGTTYVYRVYAITQTGTGLPSSEISATAGSPTQAASVPGAVSSLVAVPSSATQINLSWGAPANNGGAPITGYKIEVKKGSGGSFETLIENSQSTATSFAHTGLASGTNYYYRVSAINSAGAGTSSEASAIPKDTMAPTLTATAVSPTSITLTWVAPSQTFKQSISGYKIEQKLDQDTYVTIQENAGSSTSYTISSLTTGKTYTYVVSAVYSLGASPRSAEATATPLSTSNAVAPTQPVSTGIINLPTGLVATPSSPTQIDLSWKAPSTGTILGYKIEFKKGQEQFATLIASTLNATTKYSHTGVESDRLYSYRVYSITSSGTSLASQIANATASSTATYAAPVSAQPPSPPVLDAKLSSPTEANLQWSVPANTGGMPITGYSIEYKIGTQPFKMLASKITANTFSHTGLLQNTYSYRVYAINSAGASAASNVATVDAASMAPKTNPADCGAGTIFDEKSQTCILAPKPRCGPGTIFDEKSQSCILESLVQEPTPQEPQTSGVPGFPDPTKDPQSYVNRYNSEPKYREWFEKNFPGKTIYEVVGLPEPQMQCGKGTHLEDGYCVADKKSGSGCLVATAAFGTELAPQVQLLREVRDNSLYQTSSGTAFMAGFNEFYYSFSPTISDWERQSPVFRDMVRISLTPMLSTLSILNHANIDSESAILGYGIAIILLNSVIYMVAPAMVLLVIKNKIKSR